MGILGSLFGKKKMTAAETAFIKRQSQIFADCIRIIADTTDIETYFYRYGLAEQTVAQIAEVAGGDTKCMAGGKVSPNECAEMLRNEKATHTNNFLSRYIQKETVHILGLTRGQIKKSQGIAAIVDEYAAQMPEESLKHGQELCDKMIEKIEKVVNK
jgi:hypothetical protein